EIDFSLPSGVRISYTGRSTAPRILPPDPYDYRREPKVVRSTDLIHATVTPWVAMLARSQNAVLSALEALPAVRAPRPDAPGRRLSRSRRRASSHTPPPPRADDAPLPARARRGSPPGFAPAGPHPRRKSQALNVLTDNRG